MKKVRKLFRIKKGWIYGLSGLGLTMPALVFAGANEKIMNALAEIIFRFFLWPVIGILRLELWVLPKIASYNNFTREAGVEIGWVAVRDLANTFFIVILLVIAFATILRISSYGYKQLLARLIIVAILVNFSMTIVGLAIDFSQIIMLTFLNVIKDITAGNIMVGLGLESAFSMSDSYPSGEVPNVGDFVASLIMAGIMLVITAVIIGAFIAMLAIRMVMLWISIVLAPFAFIAFVLPNTKKFYTQWSLDLAKNLSTGPALLFFLWLAFTIINGLDVRESMGLGEGDALDSFSQVTTTTNVVSYIIGTALLLGGLQFAAKSGAAGSSIMGKASQKINSTASSLGRRYVGGAASRAGYLASRSVINRDGSAKTWAKPITKFPFWGGRLQRSAMKMQGYEAQRIAGIKSEDEKYIKDTQKVQFQDSQTTMGRSLVSQEGDGRAKKAAKWLGRGAGRAYSTVSSFGGGNYERDLMTDINKIERGDINLQNAEQLTDSARTLGKEDLMQRVQAQYMTYKDEDEVFRLMENKGLAGVMTGVKSGAIEDEKTGEISKGAQIWAEAVGKHENADPKAMMKLALQNDKADRWAAFRALQENLLANRPPDQGQGVGGKGGIFSTNNNGEVKTDKKKILGLDIGKKFVKDLIATLALYPQNASDEHNEATGAIDKVGIFSRTLAAIDPNKMKFERGTVAKGLYPMPYETNEDFEQRQEYARRLDAMDFDKKDTLPEHLKDASEEDVEEYRQKKYREVQMLTRKTDEFGNTHDANGNSVDEYWVGDLDDGTEEGNRRMIEFFNPRKRARYDVSFQEKGFGKETKEEFEARKAEAAREESEEEYQARIDEMMDPMSSVDQLKEGDDAVKGMTEDEIKRYKLRKKRIIAGDARAHTDLITKTLWTETWDGGNGTRFAELDLSKQGQRELAEGAPQFMPKYIVNQAWPEAESDQGAILARARAANGHSTTKPQIENAGRKTGVLAMQDQRDYQDFSHGVPVNNPDIAGPIHYRESNFDSMVGKTIQSLQDGDVLVDVDGIETHISQVNMRDGVVKGTKNGEDFEATYDSIFKSMSNYVSAKAREDGSNLVSRGGEARSMGEQSGASFSDGGPQDVRITNADEIASATSSSAPSVSSGSGSTASNTPRNEGSGSSSSGGQQGGEAGLSPAELRQMARQDATDKKVQKGTQSAADAASAAGRQASEAAKQAELAKDAARKDSKSDDKPKDDGK